jgi:integrase
MAQAFADKEAERRTKVQQTLGIRVLRPIEVKPSEERVVPYISDSTIRFEMSIFGAVMNYAIKKRYVPASQRFDERPKLKSVRRDEFTEIVLICRCPAGAFLAANLPCTCRRWRLYFVQLQSL